jgi:hypothetical protein
MSTTLDTVLQKSVTSVPDCVAAGYVDLASGMLLGVKTVDSHPQEVIELLAAATADLFQGPSVAASRSCSARRAAPEAATTTSRR